MQGATERLDSSISDKFKKYILKESSLDVLIENRELRGLQSPQKCILGEKHFIQKPLL